MFVSLWTKFSQIQRKFVTFWPSGPPKVKIYKSAGLKDEWQCRKKIGTQRAQKGRNEMNT